MRSGCKQEIWGARAANWKTELEQMASQHTRSGVSAYCTKLLHFVRLLEMALTEQLEQGFTVPSFFDRRPTKVAVILP